MNKEKIIELKNEMISLNEYALVLKQKQEEFEEQNMDILNSIQEHKNKIEDIKDVLRDNAEAGFAKDGIKQRLGGIGIRIMKKLVYDNDEAFKWAKEKDLFLKLDVKGFEKVAKTGEVSFVNFEESTTVTFPSEINMEGVE